MTIKKTRLQRKVTQQQLADAIGVNVSVISKYETGSVTPPIKRLELIANILNVDLKELIIDTYVPYSYIERRTIKKDCYLETLIKLGAKGNCELCKKKAPFKDKLGKPYLEVFIIDENAMVLEPTQNMIALCPNCYKRITVLDDANDIEMLREIASTHNY